MKFLFGLTVFSLTLSTGVFAQANMSDDLDKNLTPAELEARKQEEKARNLPDAIDRNTTPAPFEERQQEEEMSDVYKSGSGQQKSQNSQQPTDQGTGTGTGSSDTESSGY